MKKKISINKKFIKFKSHNHYIKIKDIKAKKILVNSKITELIKTKEQNERNFLKKNEKIEKMKIKIQESKDENIPSQIEFVNLQKEKEDFEKLKGKIISMKNYLLKVNKIKIRNEKKNCSHYNSLKEEENYLDELIKNKTEVDFCKT